MPQPPQPPPPASTEPTGPPPNPRGIAEEQTVVHVDDGVARLGAKPEEGRTEARPKRTTTEQVASLWLQADTALEHVHKAIAELDRLEPASECAEARASATNARRMLSARYGPGPPTGPASF
jgi:hypothetical protein